MPPKKKTHQKKNPGQARKHPKRHVYSSLQAQSKHIHVNLQAPQKLDFSKELDESTLLDPSGASTSTEFALHLAHLSLLNLSTSFQTLLRQLSPLVQTAPLLLFNKAAVIDLLVDVLHHPEETNPEDGSGSLPSILELLPKLSLSLSDECLPFLGRILPPLLDLANSAYHLPLLFASVPAFLKPLIPAMLAPENQDVLATVWAIWVPRLIMLRHGGSASGEEQRRLVVEVWATFVRKAGRRPERMVGLMVDRLKVEEQAGGPVEALREAVGLIMIGALKGPPSTLSSTTLSPTLSSKAPDVFQTLLSAVLALPSTSSLPNKMLSNVLTAIVHHTHEKPEQAEGMIRVLVKAVEEDDQSVERVERLVNALGVVCAARRGKGVTSSLHAPLLGLLPQLLTLSSSSPSLKDAVIYLISTLLPITDLPSWLKFRSTVERLWESLGDDWTRRGALVGMWVQPGKGWKRGGDVLFGGVLEKSLFPAFKETKATSPDLSPLLTLLTNLSLSNLLSSTTFKSSPKETLGPHLASLLTSLRPLIRSAEPKQPVLLLHTLLGLIARLEDSKGPMWDALVEFLSDETEAYASGRRSDGTVLDGSFVLEELISTTATLWEAHPPSPTALNELRPVLLGSLERVMTVRQPSPTLLHNLSLMLPSLLTSKTNTGTLVPLLTPHLLSSSSTKRKAVLTILDALPLENESLGNVVRKAREIEETELSVKDARERCVGVDRLARALGSLKGSEEDERMGFEIGLSVLTAQLKVNLRPLYPATHKALSTLSETHGPEVWSILFGQLTLASQGPHSALSEPVPDWAENEDGFVEDKEDVGDEAVKCFRDPARKATEVRFGELLSGEGEDRLRAIAESRMPFSRDRLDVLNYEIELVHALTAAPRLAETHSRELVPVFLAFTSRSHVLTSSLETDDSLPSALDTPTLPRLNLKQVHLKLSAYLSLLAKFENPKGVSGWESLHALYLSLLAKGEPKLQALALDCIFTFRSNKITPYKDSLKMLLDEVRFRDELAKFSLAEQENAVVNPAHRAELIPLVIRMLYGKMIARRGRSSSSNGPAARKQAILSALAGCASSELSVLVELMLAPFDKLALSSPSSSSSSAEFTFSSEDAFIPGKQQIGFLSLLGDVIKYLGPKLESSWPRLLGTTMELVHRAQKKIGKMKTEEAEDEVAEEQEEEEEEDEAPSNVHSTPVRAIRQLGLKRFADFFRSTASADFDFTFYLPAAFSSFISPRLPSLDTENTQAPSGLLELFAIWSSSLKTVPFLVQYNPVLLSKVYSCLTATNVKPAVVSKIYDIVERLLVFGSREDEQDMVVGTIIKPYVDELLGNLSVLVERPLGSGLVKEELAKRQIRILSTLATYVTNGSQSAKLVGLLAPMLRKPSKVVPEKVKSDILMIFKNLLPLIPEFADRESSIFTHSFNLLSTLFQSLRSRQARVALCEVFVQFPLVDSGLKDIVDTVVSINSFSERRKEEPDFDRRLAAFSALNERLWSELTVQQWLPVIYNMLFYIQDPEEMSIRTNSAFGLRRFVERTASSPDDQPFLLTFTRVLFPGLRNGLRTRTELVRTEILGVLSTAVSLCTHIPILQEMQPLLAGGDAEASFFTNIHHIQNHRRIRALHRLSELCDQNVLTNSNLLADIFLPLLAHFINNSSGKTDHHLINEAITSTGKISRQLKWAAYNGLVRQYIRLAKEKTENEKFFIRTVVSILDNFHFLMEEPVVEEVAEITDEVEGVEPTLEDQDIIVMGEESAVTGTATEPVPAPKTSQALYIADAVETRLLPSLLSYLQQKDETEDSIRIPIAIGIVKVALNLPEQSREAQIARLLTTLSQVFRSKSQETRDLAKETIIKIAVILGPEWLAPLIHEMKASLQRGPQLHVLAFTVHAILVHVTSLASSEFSDLDDCVHDVVAIAAEVVFGESGKDLQAEGFKTKMREVRTSTSKGLDTFQLVARLISPDKIGQILVPIKEVLGTTQVLKVLQQVDDVLRRVASGLNSNERLSPSDVLVLCHTLIGQNSHLLQGKQRSVVLKDSQATKNFLVSVKRTTERVVDHYASNAYKFVGFGLELFITAFRRGRFDFSDADVLGRLDPLVNLIGESLFSAVSDIVILGLKATAAVVKAPVESLTAALPTFVQQIFKTIKHAGSTESDLSQQALRTLSVVLRDCKEVTITPKQMSYLLELITPDLEDPSRQAAIFALLHAIISRKFVVADIYDVMDKVAQTMVTSQSAHVQEQCRSNVLRFLLDYPQGSGRLKKQMQFLVNNLTYVYESGRLSVMELLSAVFNKFDEKHIQDYSDSFFMGLALVIANDDSVKCREMAAELLKGLLPRLTSEQLADTVSKVHTWASTTSQPQLPRLAAQIYGLFLDCMSVEARPYISSLLIDVQEMLTTSATTLEAYEIAQEDPSPFAMEIADDLDWQLPYQSLSTLAKVLKLFPDEISTVDWQAITGHLLFPHAWVRLASARLVGTLFGSTKPSFDASQSDPEQDEPLQPRGMFNLARQSLLQLKGESIDEALAMQVVKNIVFLGRCFALGTSVPAPVEEAVIEEAPKEAAEEDEEDLDGEDEEEEEEEKAPEDEEETAEEEGVFKRALDNPLAWLFTKLSQLARTILITRPAVHGEISPRRSLPVLSIFRLFAALASVLDPALTKQFLMQILHPVQRVLDVDQKGDEEIKNLGIELQTLIQTKVGISAFSSIWNSIQRTKAMKRQARRTEKVVRSTTNPEGAAQRKRYKNEQKKESHKRKIRGFADSKIRERPMKARRTRDPMPDDA